MRDTKNKYKTFSRRAFVLNAVKSVSIGCLVGRFYYLQILNSSIYQTLSNKNRLRIFLTPPIRGEILDINGKVLANNKKTYSLVLKREFRQNLKSVIKKINNITINQKISFEKIIKKSKSHPLSQQIKLSTNITLQDAILLDSDPHLIEIDIIEEYVRQYKLQEKIFHPIGYIGSVSLNDLQGQNIPKNYNFLVGKDGIEKEFNHILQGKPGIKKIEVDAKGNFIKKIDVVPSIKGHNIQTSINYDVQKVIWDQISEYKGAVLVSDLNNQKIIGMVSSPSIDPNIFIDGISSSKWNEIIQDKYHPLVNKSISSQYSPGSVFKVVIFLSILKSGIDQNEKVFCPGYYKLGNSIYSCWKKYGHGYVNLEEALIKSCNVYFFHHSLKVGIKNISRMARLLGLGYKTNITLPYEVEGIIPNVHWKKEKYNQSWYLGDTINSSIGQGYVETTPIQLLQMVSRIAIGECYEPSILNDQSNRNSNTELLIKHEHLNILRTAMFKVVNNLNISSLKLSSEYEDFKIAGKTGTSQVISAKHDIFSTIYKDHSLFIGYAPFHFPRFAIATIIENGGWGSKTALPISIKILYYLRNLYAMSGYIV